MEIFYLTVFIAMFLAFISDNLKNIYINRVFVSLLILVITIMPAFRSMEVGTDTHEYILMFQSNKNIVDFLSEGIEPLFVLTFKFIKYLGFENYSFYFFIYSLIFNSIFIIYSKKIFGSLLMPVTAFLTVSIIYLSHFNILRQSMAVAIFLSTIYFFLKKENSKFFLSFILGVFFHYSFIANILFFVFIKFYEKSKKIGIILLSLFFLVFTNINFILGYLSGFLPFLRISNHIGKVQESSAGIKLLIMNISIFVIYLCFRFLFKFVNDRRVIVLDSLFMFALIYGVSIQFFNVPLDGPGRVIYYYYIFYLFIFWYFVEIFKINQKYFVSFFIIILSIIYIIFLFSFGNVHSVFPYNINPFLVKGF